MIDTYDPSRTGFDPLLKNIYIICVCACVWARVFACTVRLYSTILVSDVTDTWEVVDENIVGQQSNENHGGERSDERRFPDKQKLSRILSEVLTRMKRTVALGHHLHPPQLQVLLACHERK
jgi:hypothetical protein